MPVLRRIITLEATSCLWTGHGVSGAVLIAAVPAIGSADHRDAGLARRHHDDQRQAAPTAGSAVWRRNQGRCLAVEILVGAAHRASQRRAQHPADYHG